MPPRPASSRRTTTSEAVSTGDDEEQPTERGPSTERRRLESRGKRARPVQPRRGHAVVHRSHERWERRGADRDEREEQQHQHRGRGPGAKRDTQRDDDDAACQAADGERPAVPHTGQRSHRPPASTPDRAPVGRRRPPANHPDSTPRRSSAAATSTNGAPWAMLPSTNVAKHGATPALERLTPGCSSTTPMAFVNEGSWFGRSLPRASGSAVTAPLPVGQSAGLGGGGLGRFVVGA